MTRKRAWVQSFLFLGNTKRIWTLKDHQFMRRYVCFGVYPFGFLSCSTMFTHHLLLFNKNWTRRSVFDARRFSDFFYMMVLSVAINQKFAFKLKRMSNIACCWFSGLMTFQEEIQKFKRQYIYKHIMDTDARDHVYPFLVTNHDIILLHSWFAD